MIFTEEIVQSQSQSVINDWQILRLGHSRDESLLDIN